MLVETWQITDILITILESSLDPNRLWLIMHIYRIYNKVRHCERFCKFIVHASPWLNTWRLGKHLNIAHIRITLEIKTASKWSTMSLLFTKGYWYQIQHEKKSHENKHEWDGVHFCQFITNLLPIYAKRGLVMVHLPSTWWKGQRFSCIIFKEQQRFENYQDQFRNELAMPRRHICQGGRPTLCWTTYQMVNAHLFNLHPPITYQLRMGHNVV